MKGGDASALSLFAVQAYHIKYQNDIFYMNSYRIAERGPNKLMVTIWTINGTTDRPWTRPTLFGVQTEKRRPVAIFGRSGVDLGRRQKKRKHICRK